MSDSVLFLKNQDVNKKIEDSYTSNFFSSSIKDIVNIAEDNMDNPAKLNLDTSAYIEGNSKDIPTVDKEKINKPFEEMNKAYSEQALENLSIAQVQSSKEKDMAATFDSYDTLEYVTEKNHPQKVQAIAESAFFRNLHQNVTVGNFTAEEAMKIAQMHAETQVGMLYHNVALAEDVDVEGKIRIRQQILDGTTGNETVDSLPYQIRLEALLKVDDNMHKLDERAKQIRDEQNYQTKTSIEDALVRLDKEDISGLDKQIEMNKLRAMARNKEQIDLVNNWNTDNWEPTEDVQLAIEQAQRQGIANRKFFDDLKQAGLISTGTYRKELNNLDNYLNVSLQQGEHKLYDEIFKASFGYNPLGGTKGNEAYYKAKAAYTSYLSNLKRPATPEDHKAAYDYAMSVQQAYPGAVDKQRDDKLQQFYNKYQDKITYDKAIGLERQIRADLREKGKFKDVSEEKKRALVNGEFAKQLLSDGVFTDATDANIFVTEFGQVKELRGE